MNIVEYLLGKEVIDDSGMLMGVVKDVTWDFESNRVESLVVEKGGGGLSSIFGSGEKQFVLYENIHSIGDKILVNIRSSSLEVGTDDENILSRFGI